MHVFVNSTEIRKLEREKAVNKCQQLMFTCVSHEFRTPLNAFSNSLKLVEFTIQDFKAKLSKFSEATKEVSRLYPKLDKMIKIGNVS